MLRLSSRLAALQRACDAAALLTALMSCVGVCVYVARNALLCRPAAKDAPHAEDERLESKDAQLPPRGAHDQGDESRPVAIDEAPPAAEVARIRDGATAAALGDDALESCMFMLSLTAMLEARAVCRQWRRVSRCVLSNSGWMSEHAPLEDLVLRRAPAAGVEARLARFPLEASIPLADRNSQLPLHFLIESQMHPLSVTAAVLRTNPQAARARDDRERVLPVAHVE